MQSSPLKFAIWFAGLFLVLYYFNLFFFGLTNPGGLYSPFIATHLDYIANLRWLLLQCSACLLRAIGFSAITNNYELLVAGRGTVRLVYSCLGLGVISFFTAFVLAYPKPLKARLIFLFTGIFVIEALNVLRFVLLVLFWHRQSSNIADHHTIFNIFIYIIIGISLYIWVKRDITVTNTNANNRS